jgi:hypothetical protein
MIVFFGLRSPSESRPRSAGEESNIGLMRSFEKPRIESSVDCTRRIGAGSWCA